MERRLEPPMNPTGHAVWVTPQLDWLGRSGGALRTLRLLEGLASRLPVHVVVVGGWIRGVPPKGLDLVSVRRFDGLQGLRARFHALRAGIPVYASRAWNPSAHADIEALSSGGIVVLDHLAAIAYRPSAGPYVLHLHNVESDRLRDRNAGSVARVIEQSYDRWATKRAEGRVRRDKRHLVVVVSERDRGLFGEGRVVPNGADLPREVSPRPREGSMLFVGALDYPPNADALRWWSSDIGPRLPGRLARLTAVGRAPLPELAGLEHIDLIGEVDDVAPYLHAAAVVVVPLREGGGSRLKILEAMAFGRPVVSTSKGMEGLDLRPGEDLLVADAPADFAEAVMHLERDAGLAARLCERGLAAAALHDWKLLAADFGQMVESWAHGSPTNPEAAR